MFLLLTSVKTQFFLRSVNTSWMFIMNNYPSRGHHRATRVPKMWAPWGSRPTAGPRGILPPRGGKALAGFRGDFLEAQVRDDVGCKHVATSLGGYPLEQWHMYAGFQFGRNAGGFPRAASLLKQGFCERQFIGTSSIAEADADINKQACLCRPVFASIFIQACQCWHGFAGISRRGW